MDLRWWKNLDKLKFKELLCLRERSQICWLWFVFFKSVQFICSQHLIERVRARTWNLWVSFAENSAIDSFNFPVLSSWANLGRVDSIHTETNTFTNTKYLSTQIICWMLNACSQPLVGRLRQKASFYAMCVAIENVVKTIKWLKLNIAEAARLVPCTSGKCRTQLATKC